MIKKKEILSSRSNPTPEMSIPASEDGGFIRTLNKMGYMTSTLDPFSQRFVDYSKTLTTPVLEIGAAFGVASLECLRNGVQVIANDLDPRHLEILKSSATEEQQENLTLLPGSFPDGVSIDSNSVGGVLICRVLHFFDGPAIESALRKIYDCLVPGGKAFIVADTPYLRSLQRFLPVYTARKAAGDLWPGLILDLANFTSVRAESLPQSFHVLDAEVLTGALVKTGFRVENASTFAQVNYPDDIRLDGKEGVGIIAIKPITCSKQG